MTQQILDHIEKVTRLLSTDPMAAADRIDDIAVLLRMYAHRLRQATLYKEHSGHAPTSPGGVGDSCRMKVSGPNGVVTQDTNTGA